MQREKKHGFFRRVQSRISFGILIFFLMAVCSVQLSPFCILWSPIGIVPGCAYTIHQEITRNGLRNAQGLSEAEIDEIASHSKDPDVDKILNIVIAMNPSPSDYHFLGITNVQDYNYVINVLENTRNAAVGFTDSAAKGTAITALGYIMHMTQDLFSHTLWTRYHQNKGDLPDLCRLDVFDRAFEELLDKQGLDCAHDPEGGADDNPLWHVAVADAELMAGYQFQFYLKEIYREHGSIAEGVVSKVFPQVKDLVPYIPITGAANSDPIDRPLNLYWNNFTDESITVQLLKNSILLGNIAEVPANEWHTAWKIDNKINGQTILPDIDYQIRLVRGNKCIDGASFGLHGIVITNPAANAAWKIGSTQSITINSYLPGVNYWKLYLQNAQGERIGQIVANKIGIPSEVTTKDFSWMVGRFIDGSDAELGVYRIECFAEINATTTKSFYSDFFPIVGEVPGKPVLISPADIEPPVNTTTPTFKWKTVPASPAVDFYKVQINYNNSAVYSMDNISSLSHKVLSGKLSFGKTYKWYVRAHNASGWGDWSGRTMTLIEGNKPTAPILVSPADNAPSVPFKPTLTWNAVSATPTVNYYQVKINSQGSQYYLSGNITATSFTATTLVPEETYQWYVRAYNVFGWSDWSAGRTFKVRPEKPEKPTD